MTKIKDILSIRLEDDIKSVIDLNQQDERSIIDELDGFILTESLAKLFGEPLVGAFLLSQHHL